MMIKLYSETAISGSKEHKITRDECVDKFGFLLGLKDQFALLDKTVDGDKTWGNFEASEILHGKGTIFQIGSSTDDTHKPYEIKDTFTFSRKEYGNKILDWMRDVTTPSSRSTNLPFENERKELMERMVSLGFVENSIEWNVKFGKTKY